MASSTNKSTATVFCKAMILLQLPLFATVFILLRSKSTTTSCYNSIISFGDSIADTGNYLVALGEKAGPVGHHPYGKTYFRRPTGRFSDGRVIIDFIAEAVGLPLVPPYLARTSKEDIRYGINFAVAGVTALDGEFFRSKGMALTWPQYSLTTQIQWFKELLPSLCSSKSGESSLLHAHFHENFDPIGIYRDPRDMRSIEFPIVQLAWRCGLMI